MQEFHFGEDVGLRGHMGAEATKHHRPRPREVHHASRVRDTIQGLHRAKAAQRVTQHEPQFECHHHFVCGLDGLDGLDDILRFYDLEHGDLKHGG